MKRRLIALSLLAFSVGAPVVAACEWWEICPEDDVCPDGCGPGYKAPDIRGLIRTAMEQRLLK